MILLHRPGRARHDGARGVPGDRLSPDVRRRWPNGWPRSTTPRAIPEFIARAFHVATSGRPGPVVLALPEDMLTDTRRRAGCAGPTSRVRVAPDARAACGDAHALLSEAEAAAPGRRRRRLERGCAPRSRRPLPRLTNAGRRLLPLPGSCSTICIPAMPAMSASASTPSSPSAVEEADLLIASARGSAR